VLQNSVASQDVLDRDLHIPAFVSLHGPFGQKRVGRVAHHFEFENLLAQYFLDLVKAWLLAGLLVDERVSDLLDELVAHFVLEEDLQIRQVLLEVADDHDVCRQVLENQFSLLLRFLSALFFQEYNDSLIADGVCAELNSANNKQKVEDHGQKRVVVVHASPKDSLQGVCKQDAPARHRDCVMRREKHCACEVKNEEVRLRLLVRLFLEKHGLLDAFKLLRDEADEDVEAKQRNDKFGGPRPLAGEVVAHEGDHTETYSKDKVNKVGRDALFAPAVSAEVVTLNTDYSAYQ
jgi:hypothetical protein